MEKRNLPNATTILILGICSIVTCCCYGVIGLIFAFIGLRLATKDAITYKENPELYLNYSSLSIGKVLINIGIAINIISLVIYFYFIFILGEKKTLQMMDNWKTKMEYQRSQE